VILPGFNASFVASTFPAGAFSFVFSPLSTSPTTFGG